MGKRFTSHAVRRSYGLEGTKRPFIRCYFCLTNITGITSKSKHTVKYPNVPTAMRPVPHNEALPIPKPPANVTVDDEHSATDEADLKQAGETFVIRLRLFP
jgi:hypothetical protein